MRSLEISYDQVAADPSVCLKAPLSNKRGMDGSLLVWEGRQSKKDLKSPLFRVYIDSMGLFEYYRFNKMLNQWTRIPTLKKRKFFKPSSERNEQVVQIEMYKGNRVVRRHNGSSQEI